MAFSDPTATVQSGNAYIDGLSWGSHWNDAGSATTTRLAVYLAGDGGDEVFDFGGQDVTANTTTEEADAFVLAMAVIAEVCNVTFSAAATQAAADIIVGVVADADATGALGIGVPPGEDPGPVASQQGAVIINREQYQTADNSSLAQGGYDFITFIHELGHAIGLKHPHDTGGSVGNAPFPGVTDGVDMGDFGDFSLNQGIYTMMSYNDGFATNPAGALDPATTPGFGWEGTTMALDIAALQHLYGANTTTRTGNDTYTLANANAAGNFYSSIWDAGGIDTIVHNTNANSVIDLREASLLNGNGGGGFLSKATGVNGGFTIASGAVIENATGGGGADSITGNTAGNVLTGNGGNDFLNGGDGNDTLKGGIGNDQLAGGLGVDTADWSSATGAIVFTLGAAGNGVTANVAGINVDTLSGIENLTGGAAADTLTGNAAANLLNGGLGADRLSGLAGNDTYVVDNAGDVVTEALNAGIDTVQTTLASYTLGANLDWLVYTGTGNFTGKGNALSNKISGGAGSDYITMDGVGNDAVNGFEGKIDTIDFRLLGGAVINFVTNVNAGSAAGDSFVNIERFFGSETAADDVTGGNREAIYSGFGGNDILRGGSKADTLNGNDGNDTIIGNGSVDTIEGGRGDDTLTGNAAADVFVFRETIASGGIGQDIVTDFTDGVDKLKIGAAVATTLAGFTITGNGSTDVLLTVIGGSADSIRLQSATAISLGAGDILFF